MLEIKNITKIYHSKHADDVVALDDISLNLGDKGLVFLLGKSGSGKSTVLNTVGGLDSFDKGEIIINGKSSKDFKQKDFDAYRNTYIGFIFQEYNVLPDFTVAQNIGLALELQGKKADKATIDNILETVDLIGYGDRKPNQLSGGQKQRIAIARALVKEPQIIMADEPTGALDSNTGRQVFETLRKLGNDKLVIVVSHDRESAELYADRIIELKDGRVISDRVKKHVDPKMMSPNVSMVQNNLVHIKGGNLTLQDRQFVDKLISTTKADIYISTSPDINRDIKIS
ncbi:MAG: ABC transporter ATP-binding protein, partial [Clostridia bacterium]|nr:ABC transporter ATP-binding protein [Clostridia bacterium]